MIQLSTFFKNHFDTKRISDDKIKVFTQDHIQRLIANNTANQYDLVIQDTVNAYDAYFGSVNDEDLAYAIQQGRTIAVDNKLASFKQTVSQQEGLVRSHWNKGTEDYEQFFPNGLTEYANATKTTVETLMNRMVSAANNHLADLGQPFVDLFTNLRDEYILLRNNQLNQVGIVASDKVTTSTNRDVVEVQLMKNLLTLALEFSGQTEMAAVFFDQSIVEYPEHGDGGEQTGEQTFDEDVPENTVLNLEAENLEATDEINIENGATPLYVYFGNGPSAPPPPAMLPINPGATNSTTAAGLGYVEGLSEFLNVFTYGPGAGHVNLTISKA